MVYAFGVQLIAQRHRRTRRYWILLCAAISAVNGAFLVYMIATESGSPREFLRLAIAIISSYAQMQYWRLSVRVKNTFDVPSPT